MLAVQKLSKEGRKMGSKELNSKQQPRAIVDRVVKHGISHRPGQVSVQE